MNNVENCYFCDHLMFLDVDEISGYYCKISGKKYCCNEKEERRELVCSNYCYLKEE